jgi:hypothetical protein
MLDVIIGLTHEDVYSIGRVLLAPIRTPSFVLGKYLKNLASYMAVLSKLWIAYTHQPHSSKKDDYLTTILLSHVTLVRGKQGSGPQMLDLDPTPTSPSAFSFPIIPQ